MLSAAEVEMVKCCRSAFLTLVVVVCFAEPARAQVEEHLKRLGGTTSKRPPGDRLPPDRTTFFFIHNWVSPMLPTPVGARPQGRGTEQRG